jgi:hypothetical protein
VDHIGKISAAIHFVNVFRIVIGAMRLILDCGFLEFKSVLKRKLGQFKQHVADFLTATSLKFGWRDLQVQT